MSSDTTFKPEQSELGKKSAYDAAYNPDKLFPIPRQRNRDTLGIHTQLPFYGYGYWNHYEVSWLNAKGKPIVALAKIIYSCDSINIIESKSMKLYFNSFNNTKFKSPHAVENTVLRDISSRINGGILNVRITPLSELTEEKLIPRFDGINLDDQDITCSLYHADPSFLTTGKNIVQETLCSDLLKSNCLVTNQPDWCSVQISYEGKQIDHEGLLKYIISFRNDNEFHEQCIEKIFINLLSQCTPSKLTVYGRSTRRGGLDINSYRSTLPIDVSAIKNIRLCRQ